MNKLAREILHHVHVTPSRYWAKMNSAANITILIHQISNTMKFFNVIQDGNKSLR